MKLRARWVVNLIRRREMKGLKRLRCSAWVALSVAVFSGCGDEKESASSGGGPGGGRGGWGGGRGGGIAAIPVKAENVVRGEMNAYVETAA